MFRILFTTVNVNQISAYMENEAGCRCESTNMHVR